MHLSNLLGLLFGEMVTNLLIIPGDCCIGGVRHILSSFSVLGVISSPTRILSRLPSSTPFPSHRPHGNLRSKQILLTSSRNHMINTTLWQVKKSLKCLSLVCVPGNLVADQNALHQPLCIEPRVIVTHLHCGQFAQVLALREKERNAQQCQTPEDVSSLCYEGMVVW